MSNEKNKGGRPQNGGRGGKNPAPKGNGDSGKKNPQNNRDKNKNAGGRDKNNGENRKDTYVYTLDGNLYINLTNKCSNGCSFCVRNERASYYGNYLWLRHGDPTAEKVIAAIEKLENEGRLGELRQELRETAEARRIYAEDTLQELSERLGITKSCLNHRLRKILEIEKRHV